MAFLLLMVCLSLSGLNSLSEANTTHSPRMTFTHGETSVKRWPLPEHHVPVWVGVDGEPDAVTAAGQSHLLSFNFQNPHKTPVERSLRWKGCIDRRIPERECKYKITVVHETDRADQLFVCGTNGGDTVCCETSLSEQAPVCITPENMMRIGETIRGFIIQEGEPSALVESQGNTDLYVTYSGSYSYSKEYVGIHKFGQHRVGPAPHDKEQHYVGLVLSRRRDEPLQNKVYAFYKEKNTDSELYSEMWVPFVTQVCMADIGGSKHNRQFTWTSQMNARLFCGDAASKQHFSELVDVATVHGDQWHETRVYALFRNEWGMSAVCVYSVHDIDNVFTKSPFKGYSEGDAVRRPRECVADSSQLPPDVLNMIGKTSEMQRSVWPADGSGPLLINHHNYTHIHVDSSQHGRNDHHLVLFLSLNNGAIHKVQQNKKLTFVIAEYHPFNHQTHTHILGIILQPTSGKLYVNSRSELVQLDVANCGQYGDSCESCVLARDPDCGWNGTRCTPVTNDTLQDAQGNHAICRTASKVQLPRKDQTRGSVTLPSGSKYFLRCPVSSRHAQYTWHHGESSTPNGSSTSCSDVREKQCLLLIDSMGPQQVGTYTCVSEEMGYRRVLAQQRLQLRGGAAGRSSGPLLWVCVLAVLIKA